MRGCNLMKRHTFGVSGCCGLLWLALPLLLVGHGVGAAEGGVQEQNSPPENVLRSKPKKLLSIPQESKSSAEVSKTKARTSPLDVTQSAGASADSLEALQRSAVSLQKAAESLQEAVKSLQKSGDGHAVSQGMGNDAVALPGGAAAAPDWPYPTVSLHERGAQAAGAQNTAGKNEPVQKSPLELTAVAPPVVVKAAASPVPLSAGSDVSTLPWLAAPAEKKTEAVSLPVAASPVQEMVAAEPLKAANVSNVPVQVVPSPVNVPAAPPSQLSQKESAQPVETQSRSPLALAKETARGDLIVNAASRLSAPDKAEVKSAVVQKSSVAVVDPKPLSPLALTSRPADAEAVSVTAMEKVAQPTSPMPEVAEGARALPVQAAGADSALAQTQNKEPSAAASVFGKFLAESKGLVSLNVGQYSSAASVVEPVRLDEAVAFALKNNLEIKASGSRTKSAALEKLTAYSRLLPSLDIKLSSGSERSFPASYNDTYGNRVLDDQHTRRDRVVAVRQPLIDLEVIADIVGSADGEALAANQERADRDGIIYDTISAYLKLVQAKLSCQLAEQYRVQLEELSKHMGARLEAGGATVGDLERIKVHASAAEAARAESLGEYESSMAEFRRLTQITPAQLEVLSVQAPAVPRSLPDALKEALQHNPDYVASQNKVDIATSTRNSAFAKTAPKLSLEYSDTYVYDAGGAAKGNPVDGVYPTQQDKRLLLVAHWALNGGIEVGSGAVAVEKEREARYRALDVKSRLEEGIIASYNAIHAADQRLSILQRGLESNEKVVKEFDDQYKNGSRSVFELLDAQGQLYNTRVNMMRVEIARVLAAYQVHRQMGDLLPSLIVHKTPERKKN